MKILPTPEIIAGEGVLGEIPAILNKINAKKVMVVTDRGIKAAGIYAVLERILKDSNKEIILFDEVRPDPEIRLVNKAAVAARASRIDAVIGIGGGSSIDTAKVAAAMATNDKDLNDYIGVELLEKEALPIIAVPTTAGTGSEVTPIAILSDEEEQLKKGIVSNKIIPKYAVLDPCLTTGLPAEITASCGMDALTHAIEAYTSLKANDYSDSLALKAVELIAGNLRTAYSDGKNIKARHNMLMASLLAGMSFANAGVAAVHAFAYPLGGMFHVPHGLANSLMLSTIIEFNMPCCEDKFRQVGRYFVNDGRPFQGLDVYIRGLCSGLKIPGSLSEVNIPEDAITQLAEGAMKVTRLLVNNPRPVTLSDAVTLYRQAYYKKD